MGVNERWELIFMKISRVLTKHHARVINGNSQTPHVEKIYPYRRFMQKVVIF